MSAPLDAHYKTVIKAITEGRLVPFLGAGACLCGRQRSWQVGQYEGLPSGGELTQHLIGEFSYPTDETPDLLRVSQYAAVMEGLGPLYLGLRRIFDADYPPTPLHRFLASIPGVLRGKGLTPRHQLIVTTNYDDVLERSFAEAGEPFDLVMYVADGDERGMFRHRAPDGKVKLIKRPNEYRGLALDRRPVILKIHGAVDRADPEGDSYVITEDHYIDFMTRHAELSGMLPVTLAAKLRQSHFLFLGYGLRDWNLRVILQRMWGEQKFNFKSWAIQNDPKDLDQRFWVKRDVDILDADLADYIAALGDRLQALPAAGGAP
jgi:hypothetical protein